MSSISINKKAQIWYTDFIIGVVIFTLALTIFYSNVPNIEKEDSRKLQEVSKEGELITNYLLTEGYPKDWNITTVKIIGLMDENNSLDKDKILSFDNLSRDNYAVQTKSRFKLTSDYAIMFRNMTGDSISVFNIDYIGHGDAGVGADGEIKFTGTYNHLIKYSRVIMYNKTPIELEVYTWQK